MRLANGIVIDKEATFGALKFSALRREVHLQNEDGSVSEEIKERTYDLKSRGQGKTTLTLGFRQISLSLMNMWHLWKCSAQRKTPLSSTN